MWGGIGGLIIQASAGGVSANLIGELLRKYDLGTVGNTISGIIGGGIGGLLVDALVGGAGTDLTAGGIDIGSLIAQIVAGGIGGGTLMIAIGFLKQVSSG